MLRPSAPSREEIAPFSASGLTPGEDLEVLCLDAYALSTRYGGNTGFHSIMESRTVLLATGAATIGGLLFGIDQGLVSIILVMPQFLEVFPSIDSSFTSSASFYKGLLTAMLELGAVLGAFQAGWIADKYSRRYTLLAGVFWFVAGSIIQTTSYSLAQLIVGRTVGGVGIGVLSSVAPMYVSEIAPPHMRGRLLVIEEFMIVLGIVVAYFTTYGTRYIASEWSFRLPFLLQIFPGLFLGILVYFLPFSPRWLAGQGRDQQCLETLTKLRQLPATDVRVQAEWVVIRAEAAHCREALCRRHPNLQQSDAKSQIRLEIASWMDCFSPGVIRRTHIGMGLMAFQQLVGINSLIYYSPTLFATLGFDLDLTLTMGGVMNVIQLLAVCVPLFAIDKIGRRPWLIGGSVGMTISHVVVAIMIAKFSYDWNGNPGTAWVGVAFIFAFMASFGLGWGPIPWSMPAEVHASSFRAKGVALATVSNWSFNFIVGLITPPLLEKTGYGTFVFFGVFSFLSGVWSYYIIPETRGRTLEQIDGLFNSTAAAEDEAQKNEILAIILGTAGSSTKSDSLSIRIDEVDDKV